VNAWESHQNELRDLELRAVGIPEKLEHPSLRGKYLCYHSEIIIMTLLKVDLPRIMILSVDSIALLF
jgi:hypothetical protein